MAGLRCFVENTAQKSGAESDHPSGEHSVNVTRQKGAQHKGDLKKLQPHQTKPDIFCQKLLREREALCCEELYQVNM